jgi:hypothetical protein
MEPEQKTKQEAIETYASDMAKVIESSGEAGLVKKIIHQEEEYEMVKRDLPPELKRNKLFMWAGITFLVLAFGTLAFFLLKKDINTVEVEQQFIPLIFHDQSSYLEIAGLTRDEITHTVLNQVNTTKVKSGGIEGIYLTENKQIVGLRKFISLIKGNFAPRSNTLLVSDRFLLGVMNNETKDFFILLKVRSTADIFESLRGWEDKMFSDLHGFFGVDISPETNYLLTKNFDDGIVGNKNARVLYRTSEEGEGSAPNPLPAASKIVVMYVFADETSVVIANTDKAAREVMLRLAGSDTEQ